MVNGPKSNSGGHRGNNQNFEGRPLPPKLTIISSVSMFKSQQIHPGLKLK